MPPVCGGLSILAQGAECRKPGHPTAEIIGLEKPIPINDFLGTQTVTGLRAQPF
jgi:hypothetical protein